MSWHWIGDQGIQWNPDVSSPQQFLPMAQALLHHLEIEPLPAIQEVVPGFTSLVFLFRPDYRPNATTLQEIQSWVERLDFSITLPAKPIKVIPVSYQGPDLAEVAQKTGLSEEQVIQWHSEPVYLVHFLGFLPGFPYLGGMNPRLACPRRNTPRREVPAGSVGIGGAQTGIYPVASPGGWNLIGRTDVPLFNPDQGPYLAVGDRVKFEVL